MAAITFSDEDLQLGGEHYNRPLYITGTIRDTKINRILLDCGSVVNLLPLKSLKAMGLMTSHLSPMFHTIQDRQVVVHKLAISKEKKPVKQAERRFRPELTVQIKCEVNMLIEVGIEIDRDKIKTRVEMPPPRNLRELRGIFDELMEAKALTLPEPKRPNEVGMTNYPKYFPYHHLLGHSIEDCYTFKDIIEGMINKGEIEVEGGKSKGPSASSNVISTIKEMKISPPFHYPIGPYLFIFKWEMRFK
ncbi:hypothetical protein V2J09_021208 [Rumex salicifolius]